MLRSQSWRELLGRVSEDPIQKRHILEQLEVSPVTLTRWISGESNPRPQNLRQLLQAMPEHYSLFLKLVKEEFVDFYEAVREQEEDMLEIPSEFYTQVFHALAASIPSLRFWSITRLILQQAIQHLDPQRCGMIIMMLCCTPPLPGKKVRSLRGSVGQGTGVWNANWDQWPGFTGIESLSGYVAAHGRAATIQNLQENHTYYPALPVEMGGSAMAVPLLCERGRAGSLYICSTQRDYFIPMRSRLIQRYADLLTLAFEPDEFYSADQIEIGIMPPLQVQAPAFAGFQQRLMLVKKEATLLQQPLNNQQAEQKVWQHLEEELLHSATCEV